MTAVAVTGLVIEAIRKDRVAAHVSAVAARHLGEYECLNIGSVGNEADHARREARFNVAFQSSAKLSKTRGGESSRFFPGAARDEKRRKCGAPGKQSATVDFVGHLAGASSASL